MRTRVLSVLLGRCVSGIARAPHTRTTPPNVIFTHETIVKKSKFIAFATHAASFDPSWIAELKKSHPRANHVCSAFLSPTSARSNDDGEPTGTAGQPILRAIEGEDLTNVCVAVVRIFGGTKLGAGGLIRAYGNAAREVLLNCDVERVIPHTALELTFSSNASGQVRRVVRMFQADIVGNELNSLRVNVEDDHIEEFRAKLLEVTRGQVNIRNHV